MQKSSNSYHLGMIRGIIGGSNHIFQGINRKYVLVSPISRSAMPKTVRRMSGADMETPAVSDAWPGKVHFLTFEEGTFFPGVFLAAGFTSSASALHLKSVQDMANNSYNIHVVHNADIMTPVHECQQIIYCTIGYVMGCMQDHVRVVRKVLVLSYEGEDLLILALTSAKVPRRGSGKCFFVSRKFCVGWLANRKLE